MIELFLKYLFTYRLSERHTAASGEIMITLELQNFNADQICNSGQCFRMMKVRDNCYEVIAGNHYLFLEQNQGTCNFHCSGEEFQNFWFDYFDLGRNYGCYIAGIDEEDDYLKRAAAYGSGIRILKQDLWEMIVTFLISQQNHIARIRRCINYICRQYGEKQMSSEGTVYYGFPGFQVLAEATDEELKACNLGYRSKYVIRTAQSICSGEVSLEKVECMDYEAARAELMKLYGIGAKVADCICLFALQKLQAFPVDTHIRQALEKYYPKGFPMERYKEYAGILQQYIFYYDLFGEKR